MTNRLQNNPAYRRLRSSPKVYPTHASYWLAADHLLVVDVIGFVERSRQIRLEDIELIVIRPNSLRLILSSCLAALVVPLMALTGWLLYLGVSTSDTDWYVGAGILGFFLSMTSVALAIVWFGGQTCQTRLATGVQEIRLSGLYRVRLARAFAEELRAAAAVNSSPRSMPVTDPGVVSASEAPPVA